MNSNLTVLDLLLIIVNAYIADINAKPIDQNTFNEICSLLNRGLKEAAIKLLRRETKLNIPIMLKLDEAQYKPFFNVDPSRTYFSLFTEWAKKCDVDLTTNEYEIRSLGLKEAKDVVEFIALNLPKVVYR